MPKREPSGRPSESDLPDVWRSAELPGGPEPVLMAPSVGLALFGDYSVPTLHWAGRGISWLVLVCGGPAGVWHEYGWEQV